jgi:hypothetical protein
MDGIELLVFSKLEDDVLRGKPATHGPSQCQGIQARGS